MAHMTNPLATVEQLMRHRDRQQQQQQQIGAPPLPLPPDLRDAVFFATQCLTQAAGALLRLPAPVAAQACVLLARYWLVEPPPLLLSVLKNKNGGGGGSVDFADASAGALFLAAKLSAHPVPPRDLCAVYAYLASPVSALFATKKSSPSSSSLAAANDDGKDDDDDDPRFSPSPPADPTTYTLSEGAYAARRSRVLEAEARVACALGFDMHVALPHPLAVTYLQALGFLDSSSGTGTGTGTGKATAAAAKKVAGAAVAYLNAALLSPQLLYLTHQPPALAVAAVYAAARDCGARMPDCAWWEVFDVGREELGFLVVALRSLEGWVRRERRGCRGDGDDADADADVGWLEFFARRPANLSRAAVQAELRRRGVRIGGSGGGDVPEMDEEAAMMRSLDEKADTMG
ncbi:cyclin [Xylariaceae sp. FL0804]|nr:cyclin [Xylariaceae sp. FL0804]